MDETATMNGTPLMKRLLQSLDDKLGVRCPAHPPSARHIPLHADLVLVAQRRRGFFAKLSKRRLSATCSAKRIPYAAWRR